MKNIAKRYVRIQYKRKTGSLAFCGIILPAFRQCLVLGKELQDLEKVGLNKDPFVLHVASKDRLVEFFAITDIQYGMYLDRKNPCTYYFTSQCELERENIVSVTAHGWSKTVNTVTFIYRDSRTSSAFIILPRPRFETSVESSANSRKYKVRQ